MGCEILMNFNVNFMRKHGDIIIKIASFQLRNKFIFPQKFYNKKKNEKTIDLMIKPRLAHIYNIFTLITLYFLPSIFYLHHHVHHIYSDSEHY